MGDNTYYAFGGGHGVINERTVIALANAMVSSGLARAGYRILWIDGGWWGGARAADGTITVDQASWPHGMAWIGSYLHAKGLRAGIYTDAGASGCAGGLQGGQGSYGHYQQDVNTFAAWGYDAVKVDFCGGGIAKAAPWICTRSSRKRSRTTRRDGG